MDNHVHFIAVPKFPDSLSRGIGETHRRYTSLINIRGNWEGYLWQGRFLSYPLDEAHLIAAARYIKPNPVQAGIVRRAEDYRWSSARAHLFRIRDEFISESSPLFSFGDWSKFLQKDELEAEVRLIRKHAQTGRPLGNGRFIQRLEESMGRTLLIQRPGRKSRKYGK